MADQLVDNSQIITGWCPTVDTCVELVTFTYINDEDQYIRIEPTGGIALDYDVVFSMTYNVGSGYADTVTLLAGETFVDFQVAYGDLDVDIAYNDCAINVEHIED